MASGSGPNITVDNPGHNFTVENRLRTEDALVEKTGITIFVTMPYEDGHRYFKLECLTNQTGRDLKKQIAEALKADLKARIDDLENKAKLAKRGMTKAELTEKYDTLAKVDQLTLHERLQEYLNRQILVYHRQIVEDELTLENYKIEDKDIVFLYKNVLNKKQSWIAERHQKARNILPEAFLSTEEFCSTLRVRAEIDKAKIAEVKLGSLEGIKLHTLFLHLYRKDKHTGCYL